MVVQKWNRSSETSKYFSIAYKKEDEGDYYGFYPDFIIKTKKEILFVEIKDDKDFKNENLLKLNAGKEYQKEYKGKENSIFTFFHRLTILTFSEH